MPLGSAGLAPFDCAGLAPFNRAGLAPLNRAGLAPLNRAAPAWRRPTAPGWRMINHAPARRGRGTPARRHHRTPARPGLLARLSSEITRWKMLKETEKGMPKETAEGLCLPPPFLFFLCATCVCSDLQTITPSLVD